jgi:putative ABC transport system ATP-binding protein
VETKGQADVIIRLQKVEPLPIQGESRDSELWNRDLRWPSSWRVLVPAQSGKGKTSLLSILYGLRQDYHGSVYFDEVSLRDLTLEQWTEIRRTRLTMVFQDLQLFEELTARQNVELKNQLTGYWRQPEIDDMFASLGLADKMDQVTARLSTGQQQRVAIIRALCQPFSWLLMDEPFSHLDAENAQRAQALISSACQKQNAGWILTSLAADGMVPSTVTYRL